MTARIYKPAKTAMQSGTGRTRRWVLEFEPEARREVEPLMGWTSSSDTRSQIRLTFETQQDAENYAKRNGIPYYIEKPKPRRRRPKSYADNFRYGRRDAWTH